MTLMDELGQERVGDHVGGDQERAEPERGVDGGRGAGWVEVEVHAGSYRPGWAAVAWLPKGMTQDSSAKISRSHANIPLVEIDGRISTLNNLKSLRFNLI
jgi:hypothetical protein